MAAKKDSNLLVKELQELPISEDVKFILLELSKRKSKMNQLKTRLRLLSVINTGLAIILLFWLVKMSQISHTDVFDLLAYLGSSKASIIFVILSISSMILTQSVSKEYNKHKKKYDDLREEAISRLNTGWKGNESSRVRDMISTLMHQINGVNLRHTK
ncbi:DUF2663 family protein [Paenibacillus sp. 1001270B_150601_E10]|uniref:DUF2663 family protein n=1 Tax=Paenibacillus sp. 1001270B_150601_E10 TaxID=2787079 RepID=UPI00189C807A|nr:DUF2663 family protein [Paenibacillus sp. 1001270B_150601_E10]